MFKKLLLSAIAYALITVPLIGVDNYTLSEESTRRLNEAPKGTVESYQFSESKVFPGTKRGCWVYIPAQYDGKSPAHLMVFQDGHAYVSETGQIRVPIVFDNMIHSGEMPVTIGIFVNPGHRGDNAPPDNGWGRRDNRSFEYDSLSADYAEFLINELIPFTQKKFKLNLTEKKEERAVCGMSSGGICAFTAAWERPDYFHKVLSHIGSFTNIRGGHAYPAMIRKSERRDIRVFLQDGSNDLNNIHGSWPLGNQQMAASLAFAGYDFKFVYGTGGHNGKHGGAIFPDSLRWLFRNEQGKPSDIPQAQVILESGDAGNWELVGDGYQFTDAACPAPDGAFMFSDMRSNTLYRVSPSGGKPQVWFEESPRISGMKFGPDGMLYAAAQGNDSEKQIIHIHPGTKKVTTVATGVKPNDLVVTSDNNIYFTDTGAGTVVKVPTSARGLSRPAPVAGGINRPNGIGLSPNEKFLYVSEYGGDYVWAFMISDDGSLHSGERFMTLVNSNTEGKGSGGDGMTVDIKNRAYITSNAGIQVMDNTGRLITILTKPQPGATVSASIAGKAGDLLYVCSSDKVFRRKLVISDRME